MGPGEGLGVGEGRGVEGIEGMKAGVQGPFRAGSTGWYLAYSIKSINDNAKWV